MSADEPELGLRAVARDDPLPWRAGELNDHLAGWLCVESCDTLTERDKPLQLRFVFAKPRQVDIIKDHVNGPFNIVYRCLSGVEPGGPREIHLDLYGGSGGLFFGI